MTMASMYQRAKPSQVQPILWTAHRKKTAHGKSTRIARIMQVHYAPIGLVEAHVRLISPPPPDALRAVVHVFFFGECKKTSRIIQIWFVHGIGDILSRRDFRIVQLAKLRLDVCRACFRQHQLVSLSHEPAFKACLFQVLRLDQAVTAVAVNGKNADESDVDLGQFLVAAERECLTSSTIAACPPPRHSRREDWRQVRTRSDDEGEKKSKKPKLPPNYFVALPVYEASIHQAARLAQETVIGKDPRLKPALIPLPTLHVTVMVMRLDTPEDILRAKEALNSCLPLLRPLISTPEPLAVSFKGLGHFRNQVVFITPMEDDALARVRQLAKIVEDTFASVGLFSTDSRSQFTPHLTLMKLSRAAHLRKIGIKHIDGSVYMDHLDYDFGRQAVTRIQLCSMTLAKDVVTGYYSRAEELDLLA